MVRRASSERDVVAVTISPDMKRIFTMSAGDRSVFSAKTCGVEPRTTCSTWPIGAAGAAGTDATAEPGAGAAEAGPGAAGAVVMGAAGGVAAAASSTGDAFSTAGAGT